MNTRKIKTTVLLIGSTLVSTCMLANAAPQNITNRHLIKPITRQHAVKNKKSWDLGLQKNLKINEDQAITLTRAALIMQAHRQIHTGNVTAIQRRDGRRAYLIALQNQKNKTIQRVIVNAQNGQIKPFNVKHKKRLKQNINKTA